MTKNLPKSFDDLINTSDLPVLVDFWAEWCGPCKMVSPAVQQVARDFKGKLLAVKVNVDEKPSVAAQYNIQSIPTLMLFKKGNVIWKQSGALPYEMLRNAIAQKIECDRGNS